MKSLYILLLAIALGAVSCRTKDGAPGPAGESSLTQQGSITATISFLDTSGNNAQKSFKYEYFESLSDNKFYYYDEDGEYYEVTVTRRDLNDNYNYVRFDLAGDSYNGVEGQPDNLDMEFYFVTLINNQLVEFNGDDVTISNLNLDPETGRLTFDYTCSVNYNYTTGTATGKVDVILYRSPRNIFSGS